MNATQQALISSYSDQLSSRFYSNSMALEVLISLLLILVLVVQLVKFAKKTYEWETQHETNLDMKYAEQSKSITNEQPNQPIDNQNHHSKDRDQTIADKRTAIHQRIKKEVYSPPIIRVEQIIKNKLPQLAIIAVNVAMMSSYEFMSISAYIAVVLMVISEILGMKQTQHINLKLVLEMVAKLLMVGWYINVLTVSKPSR